MFTGETDLDLKHLKKVLLDNQKVRRSEVKTSTRYEDSFCPHIDVIDKIADEMAYVYHATYGENISLTNYWGHIHDKNMSTNTHAHGDAEPGFKRANRKDQEGVRRGGGAQPETEGGIGRGESSCYQGDQL